MTSETYCALVELKIPEGKVCQLTPQFRVSKEEAVEVIEKYRYVEGQTSCRIINIYGMSGLPSETWVYPPNKRQERFDPSGRRLRTRSRRKIRERKKEPGK